tara:strand:+ start:133 stop:306 length:174 start_codon:yes stop_codon:yes gene_type:complete
MLEVAAEVLTEVQAVQVDLQEAMAEQVLDKRLHQIEVVVAVVQEIPLQDLAVQAVKV